MTDALQLQTDRLRLMACPLAVAEFALYHPPSIPAILGIQVSDVWPLDDVKDFLMWYAEQLADDAQLLGWGMWLMIHTADAIIMGDVGFKGKPDKTGSIDLGYSIVPAYRRQGYASEAASCLVAWAWQQPQIRRITAHCLQTNIGSVRILQKLGMRCINTEGQWVYWELTKD